MMFCLYDEESGGDLIWSEEQGIQITNGIYNVQLGEETPLTPGLFAQGTLYLEVRIYSTSAGWETLIPRQRLTSTAFALNADTVDGYHAWDFVGAAQTNSITSGMISDGEVENADLNNNAVTTDKIANSTILFADIAANSADSGQVMKYDGSNWVADDDEKSETGIFPAPAYNSGWFYLSANSSVTLNHNLGKNPSEYFVDLMYQDTDAYGINIRWFGGRDHWTGSGTSYGGAYYSNLDSNSVKVTRFSNDTAADSLRVRIWIVASE